jgi:hypothetical protein
MNRKGLVLFLMQPSLPWKQGSLSKQESDEGLRGKPSSPSGIQGSSLDKDQGIQGCLPQEQDYGAG